MDKHRKMSSRGFDITGPQKELEKAEALIDKSRKETKARYEQERRVVTKQVEQNDFLKKKPDSSSVQSKASSTEITDDGLRGRSSEYLVGNSMSTLRVGTSKASDLAPSQDSSRVSHFHQSPQEDMRSQFCFLYETSLHIINMAEMSSKTEAARRKVSAGVAPQSTRRRSTAVAPAAAVTPVESEVKSTPEKDKGKRIPKSAAELKIMENELLSITPHTKAPYGSGSVSSDAGQESATMKAPGSGNRKVSLEARLPQWSTDRSADEQSSGSRKVSTISERSRKVSSNVDRKFSEDFQGKRLSGSVSIASKRDSMDRLPAQGAAINLMMMVRALAVNDINKVLDERAIRILRTVIDESRNAIKMIKAGMDASRTHERMMRKLTSLIEILKPEDTDDALPTIPPEELLNCGYLRLSKENVERLEQMLLDEGINPGVHCHSDITNINIFKDRPHGRLSVSKATGTGVFQPPPIYATKHGSTIDRNRTARPALPDEEKPITRSTPR